MNCMIDPQARLREESAISYAESLAWLHAAIGEELVVEIGPRDGIEAVRLRGRLEGGRELWAHPESAVVFDVGGAEVSLWPRHFENAWRLRLELPDGEFIDAIEVELSNGTTLSLSVAPPG